MKIEDVEKLEKQVAYTRVHGMDDRQLSNRAIAALRAEAWHPIEKAEELGAKDGRWVLVYRPDNVWEVALWDNNQWEDFITWEKLRSDPTHFRFINPPEVTS